MGTMSRTSTTTATTHEVDVTAMFTDVHGSIDVDADAYDDDDVLLRRVRGVTNSRLFRYDVL
jgi:hypothetical protein